MIVLPRRGLLSGIIALATAPAIVRASSLMSIKPVRTTVVEKDLFLLRRNGGSPLFGYITFVGVDQFGRQIEETVPFNEKSRKLFRVVHSIRVA